MAETKNETKKGDGVSKGDISTIGAKFQKFFSFYSHQEDAMTTRTNLMLVAQAFIVVGFVEATSNRFLRSSLAILGIVVTIFTIYIGMREKEFLLMLRGELKKIEKKLPEDEQVFGLIDKKLVKKWWVKLFFKARASTILCYPLWISFLIFWVLCLCFFCQA